MPLNDLNQEHLQMGFMHISCLVYPYIIYSFVSIWFWQVDY